MVVFLQESMDYDNLSYTLIQSQKTELLFDLFEQESLTWENRKRAILAAFIESLRIEEMAVTVKIWHEYD